MESCHEAWSYNVSSPLNCYSQNFLLSHQWWARYRYREQSWKMLWLFTFWHGCFQKYGYPQIINFNRVFHYKPSILGYPYFWKHPDVVTFSHFDILRSHISLPFRGYSLIQRVSKADMSERPFRTKWFWWVIHGEATKIRACWKKNDTLIYVKQLHNCIAQLFFLFKFYKYSTQWSFFVISDYVIIIRLLYHIISMYFVFYPLLRCSTVDYATFSYYDMILQYNTSYYIALDYITRYYTCFVSF